MIREVSDAEGPRVDGADPVVRTDGAAETVALAARSGLPEARRDEIRARALASLPRWYNPYAHLLSTTGIGVVVLVASLWAIHAVKPLEWLVVPVVFLLANAFEWRVHRDVLHRRRWPVAVIYDQHTPMHHMIYVEEDMQLRSAREMGLVLIPAAGVLGVVVVTAPVAWGVAALLGANAGWLFLVSASLYMVGYELSHLAYHLPATSFIGRNPLVRVLRTHHARHHDPRLMQRYNFNVTIPLFDWLRGTIAPPSAPPKA